MPSATPQTVDVNAGKLEIQDYSESYWVGFDEEETNVDFTGAQGTAATEFDQDNPICGDAADETVDFYVVCECDESSGSATLPTKTKSGKDLKR